MSLSYMASDSGPSSWQRAIHSTRIGDARRGFSCKPGLSAKIYDLPFTCDIDRVPLQAGLD